MNIRKPDGLGWMEHTFAISLGLVAVGVALGTVESLIGFWTLAQIGLVGVGAILGYQGLSYALSKTKQ